MRSSLNRKLKTLKLGKFIKYVSGEIILIVIGILIAFQLSNWADNQRNKRIEIAALKDLLGALQLDKYDLETDIYWYNQGLISCDTIIALLEDKLIYSKEMDKYFSGPYMPVFFGNSGPYEALKSRGFEIISNDSIRNKIVKIHEFNYYGLRRYESAYNEYIQTVENNFYQANFERKAYDAYNWDRVPNDFSKLKQNKEYAYCVKSIRQRTDFILREVFLGTKKEVDALISDLGSEIKRLE